MVYSKHGMDDLAESSRLISPNRVPLPLEEGCLTFKIRRVRNPIDFLRQCLKFLIQDLSLFRVNGVITGLNG